MRRVHRENRFPFALFYVFFIFIGKSVQRVGHFWVYWGIEDGVQFFFLFLVIWVLKIFSFIPKSISWCFQLQKQHPKHSIAQCLILYPIIRYTMSPNGILSNCRHLTLNTEAKTHKNQHANGKFFFFDRESAVAHRDEK